MHHVLRHVLRRVLRRALRRVLRHVLRRVLRRVQRRVLRKVCGKSCARHLHARRSCATMKTFTLPYFAALSTFTPSSFPSFAALLRHDGNLHARRSCATMKSFKPPYFAAFLRHDGHHENLHAPVLPSPFSYPTGEVVNGVGCQIRRQAGHGAAPSRAT